MRVLIANDGSPGADQATDLARAIGWPPETHLRLVAGLGSQVSGTAWTFREAQALADSVARQLDAHLEEVEQQLARESLTVERTLVSGRPASAIVEEALEFQADLVITGSRGHGLVKQLLLGSVAAVILDRAPCPVLVARSAEPNAVLFATDGSDASATALDVLERWPIFERALRNTVNLFDDPWRLATQHPLLPVLLALGAYTVWRSAVVKQQPLPTDA